MKNKILQFLHCLFKTHQASQVEKEDGTIIRGCWNCSWGDPLVKKIDDYLKINFHPEKENYARKNENKNSESI